ncbi:hypothetical protein K456DRAFT_138825 [Colletotrichum gloeosporioides 23]|nr:hypothetical protein K456DRAFT_138825 [Colletotrichum gloeosporioides 23]
MVPPSGSRCYCCWAGCPSRNISRTAGASKQPLTPEPSTPLIPNISEPAERLPRNAVQSFTLLVRSLAHGRRRESIAAPIAHRQARCRQEGAYLTAAAGFGTASPSPATMLHLSPNSPLTLVHGIG